MSGGVRFQYASDQKLIFATFANIPTVTADVVNICKSPAVAPDDCYYESGIGKLVFVCTSFEEVPDELFDFYHRQIEKACEAVEASNQSMAREALIIYASLLGQVDSDRQ